MSKHLYMHLIAGKPAMYEPGKQIVFVNRYNKITAKQMFVGSLSTIHRQQKLSRQWRIKNNLGADLPSEYGYLRILK